MLLAFRQKIVLRREIVSGVMVEERAREPRQEERGESADANAAAAVPQQVQSTFLKMVHHTFVALIKITRPS